MFGSIEGQMIQIQIASTMLVLMRLRVLLQKSIV